MVVSLLNPLRFFTLFAAASVAQAQTFTHLSFHSGQDTSVHGLRLKLQEPDNPADPTLWQGPLTISQGPSKCDVAASLISDVYLSSSGRLLVVISISGSTTSIQFFRPENCAAAFPPIKASTEGVQIIGAKLTVLPLCECPDQGQPCSCTAGSVYRLREDQAPTRLESDSNALNRHRLGSAFTGTRAFARRPSS